MFQEVAVSDSFWKEENAKSVSQSATQGDGVRSRQRSRQPSFSGLSGRSGALWARPCARGQGWGSEQARQAEAPHSARRMPLGALPSPGLRRGGRTSSQMRRERVVWRWEQPVQRLNSTATSPGPPVPHRLFQPEDPESQQQEQRHAEWHLLSRAQQALGLLPQPGFGK